MIFTDPAVSKIYGTFVYSELKPKDFSGVFAEMKKTTAEAIKAGTFATADPNAEPLPVFEPSEVIEWESSAGSKISARLTAVEAGETFVLETADGKTVKVTPAQLTEASLAKAREVVDGK